MKKSFKLVFAETKGKLENGALVLNPTGVLSTYNKAEAGDKDAARFKVVEPYLISEDKPGLDDLLMFSIKGRLVEACFDDFLGAQIDWVKKIVATPDQIGYLCVSGLHLLGTDYIDLEVKHMNEIILNGGECKVEVHDMEPPEEEPFRAPSIHSNYSESVEKFEKLNHTPILFNNKVIIHLHG